MRSRLSKLALMLGLAGALAAVGTATAAASPEWYVKKKGTWSKVATAVDVSLTGSFELHAATYEFTCEKNTVVGTIGSSGLGTLTTFEVQQAEKNCKGPEKVKENGKEALNECPRVTSFPGANLPWGTELYSEGTEKRAKIVPHSGGAHPAVRFICKGLLGESTIECGNLETSFKLTNDLTLGLVEAASDSKSKKVTCRGVENAAAWSLKESIQPTETEQKAGVEGVKVE
jgi:hypothetical protein